MNVVAEPGPPPTRSSSQISIADGVDLSSRAVAGPGRVGVVSVMPALVEGRQRQGPQVGTAVTRGKGPLSDPRRTAS